MNNLAFRYYEFGPFRLSITDRLLMRGDAVVSLTPKLVDTLFLLVENSGHVLSKDKLMESLWPNTFVEESSLTQNISLLRKALAETGETQQYIETIPKRGYRFVAEVEVRVSGNGANGSNGELLLHESTSTQVLFEEQLITDPPVVVTVPAVIEHPLKGYARVYWKHTALMLGLLVLVSAAGAYVIYQTRSLNSQAPPKLIAVLPFKTVGAQSESELMGLGMADALILRLNRLEGAVVLPTGSVFRYTNRDKDTTRIARELGVDAVLDGTVQRDGDRVRVTAQLIRSSDGKALWSESFDEPYKDLFSLQDSISEQMANAIGRQIWKAAAARKDSLNAEAQQAYLMGFYFWNRRTRENLSKATQYFEQAVEKDSSFAQAHAMLADCYFLSSQEGYETLAFEESFKRARVSAARALALNDQVAEAHTVQAEVLWYDRDLEGADRAFRRALEINPNYAVGHLRYGYFLLNEELLTEALREMQRAQQLDPVSPVSNASLALLLFMTRDIDGSIKFNRRALELQPDVIAARYNLGISYLQKQMFAAALAEFDKLESTATVMSKLGKTKAHALAGNLPAARQNLSEILHSHDRNMIGTVDFAILYSTLGEKQTAFKLLEQLPARHSMAITRLRFDPELDQLRSDPRFSELVARHEAGKL
jgi:DNA-binding winged helix-turn-helix (wHTH) protein/TolB-like protein/Tfp pilus assembly protein PilF